MRIFGGEPVARLACFESSGAVIEVEGQALEKGLRTAAGSTPALHIDVSYINICATFYYLCSILDGYSRFRVH